MKLALSIAAILVATGLAALGCGSSHKNPLGDGGGTTTTSTGNNGTTSTASGTGGCTAGGSACQGFSECCSGVCANQVCTSCSLSGKSCDPDGCCVGLVCYNGQCLSCKDDGQTCELASDCCSNICDQGTCLPSSASTSSSSSSASTSSSSSSASTSSSSSSGSTVMCGNGMCEARETCTNCPADCGACPCLHDKCVAGGALMAACDPCVGQICAQSPACCSSSWGLSCVSKVGSLCGLTCGGGPMCGNAICETGETCSSCPGDCGPCPPMCGNGTCESGENCVICPADCGMCSLCGNGTCDSGETCASCSADCGVCPVCGNGTCETGETSNNCPADCGTQCEASCDHWLINAVPYGALCDTAKQVAAAAVSCSCASCAPLCGGASCTANLQSLMWDQACDDCINSMCGAEIGNCIFN